MVSPSMRKVDEAISEPWLPVHEMRERKPLEPGVVYPLSIDIRPYGIRFGTSTEVRSSGNRACTRGTRSAASAICGTALGDTKLVAVHGGPGNSLASIEPDFGPLNQRYTVIYYDQRGNGRSDLVRVEQGFGRLNEQRAMDVVEQQRILNAIRVSQQQP